jgi:hypothetical protein
MVSQRIGGKAARKTTKTRSAQGGAQKTSTGAGWQAEKSALTRQAILEAAVRCFVQHGYTNTTTAMIAEEGGRLPRRHDASFFLARRCHEGGCGLFACAAAQ